MSIWDEEEPRKRRRLRRGERRCWCGVVFVPRWRQRLAMCPLHKERHEQQLGIARRRRWRRKQRLLAQAYVELVVKRRWIS